MFVVCVVVVGGVVVVVERRRRTKQGTHTTGNYSGISRCTRAAKANIIIVAPQHAPSTATCNPRWEKKTGFEIDNNESIEPLTLEHPSCPRAKQLEFVQLGVTPTKTGGTGSCR
jgi:hypothetical protein